MSKGEWTHRAGLLVALDGETWTEEQVGDGHQQGFGQRPGSIIILIIIAVSIKTLADKETSSEMSRDAFTVLTLQRCFVALHVDPEMNSCTLQFIYL